MHEQGLCGGRGGRGESVLLHEISALSGEQSEIPEKWRAQALSEVEVTAMTVSRRAEDQESRLIGDRTTVFPPVITENKTSATSRTTRHSVSSFYPWSTGPRVDHAVLEGAYIDLSINPERFTGYAGDSAHHVWQAIYEENCFGLSEAAIDAASKGHSAPVLPGLPSAVIGAGGKSAPTQAGGWGFSKLSEGWGTEMIKGRSERKDLCEEKKVYYRVISGERLHLSTPKVFELHCVLCSRLTGLHASISIHICHDYLDQQTGEWAPDLQCFITRLASHPERLSNVYFNTVLLLRAVARAAPYLKAYDIGTAPISRYMDEQAVAKRQEDKQARTALSDVLKLAKSDEIAIGFDEGDFFTGEDAVVSSPQTHGELQR